MSTDKTGLNLDERHFQAEFESEEIPERFRRLKQESQGRMGEGYIKHSEFVEMLLDLWEFHLEHTGELPEDCG